MRKILIVFMAIMLLFSLVSCAKNEEEDAPNVPPGFNVIQKQQKMSKHSEKGENASFSTQEFENFLGEKMTYITVTTLPENGTLICNGNAVIKGQNISAHELEFMKFIPNGDCQMSSFNFTCDSKGYYGKEMCCDMVFSESVNASPVVADGVLETVSGISCNGKLAIREPNGDDFTINVITYPTDGYVKVSDNGEIVYTPEEGFYGRDELVFSVTDCFGKVSETATLKINVNENQSGICFSDMADNPNHLFAHKMCQENVMVYRYENGEYYFDPDKPVSKMDFLVMAMCVSGLDSNITAVADSVADDDNGLSSGLKGYLSEAYKTGLIKLDNGKFMPRENITIADAAYMVSVALKLPATASSEASSGYNSVNTLVNVGLLEGEVDSNSVLTKAQSAKLLCAMSDYIKENNIQK